MSGTQRRIRILLSAVFCVVLFAICVASTAVARQQEGGPEGPLDFAASGISTTDRTTAGASSVDAVSALDAVGNESGASNAVSLTLGVKSGGPGGSGGGNGGGKGKNR